MNFLISLEKLHSKRVLKKLSEKIKLEKEWLNFYSFRMRFILKKVLERKKRSK